jgi:hypothetical protein
MIFFIHLLAAYRKMLTLFTECIIFDHSCNVTTSILQMINWGEKNLNLIFNPIQYFNLITSDLINNYLALGTQVPMNILLCMLKLIK